MNRRKRVLYLSGFAAVVTAASIAAAVTASGSRTAHKSTVGLPIDAASSAITAQLSVLSRPRTAADAVPAAVQSHHWGLEQIAGANAELARRQPERSGASLYYVPSQRGVCVVASDGPENFCATATEVEQGRAMELLACAPASVPSSEIEVDGILPDDSTAAQVRLTDGTSSPLTLEGNGYSARFARDAALPATIEWKSADGEQHSTGIQLPGGTADESCGAPNSAAAAGRHHT